MAAFIAARRTEDQIPCAVSCRALQVSRSWHYKLDSDGILFGVAGPYGLLPHFVLTMQASTGRSTVLPLPLAGSVLVGATATLLMVLSQGGRNYVITALGADDATMAGLVV